MISKLLKETARDYPDRFFLVDDHARLNYRESTKTVKQVAQKIQALGIPRLYIYATDSMKLIVFLLATDLVGIEVCVIGPQSSVEEVVDIMSRIGPGILVTDDKEGNFEGIKAMEVDALYRESQSADALRGFPHRGEGKIIALTTGTTGKPKGASYTWKRLVQQGRIEDQPIEATWLLVYPLNHFGSIQILLHVLRSMSALVIPKSREFDQIIHSIKQMKVDSISATPTFWRMFMGKLTPELAKQIKLRQITMGGEASTSDILAKLRACFPQASISQVYATTELGSCFSVKDGSPGFPTDFLDRPVGNTKLRIIDGELYVKSDNRMLGYVDGSEEPHHISDWYATGDLVEVVGNRVFFRGRKTEIINVGGVKVHPLKVEELILSTDGVQATRVYGKQNPITGQIVAADIEVDEGFDEEYVLQAVKENCQSQLNRYERPRHMQIVESLPKRNTKVLRR